MKYEATMSWGASDQNSKIKLDFVKVSWRRQNFFKKIYRHDYPTTRVSKLLNELKANDTLIVTKLDRFARNTTEALELLM